MDGERYLDDYSRNFAIGAAVTYAILAVFFVGFEVGGAAAGDPVDTLAVGAVLSAAVAMVVLLAATRRD